MNPGKEVLIQMKQKNLKIKVMMNKYDISKLENVRDYLLKYSM